jgi:NAD-dependent deacetylase
MLQAHLLAQRIREKERIVALTGAGISTAAGIPDFRGPRGIYVTRVYPEDVFDIGAFVSDPRGFYAFARDFLQLEARLQPTFAHSFLAHLEATGRLTGVITQNIDGLHQKAGSRVVIEVHGGFGTTVCLECDTRRSTAEVAGTVLRGEIPRCAACGGLVKPDIVFFGESVRGMDRAGTLVRESDLLLVVGSSLTVYPAAGLPALAGGDVVIVGRGPVLAPAGAARVDVDIEAFFRAVGVALAST